MLGSCSLFLNWLFLCEYKILCHEEEFMMKGNLTFYAYFGIGICKKDTAVFSVCIFLRIILQYLCLW